MKHPTNNITRRVAVMGCKHTTRELISGLEGFGFGIDHCITISQKKAQEQKVAGYMDLKPFLEKKSIPCTIANTYSLNSDKDKELLGLNLDMVLVMGWQRLLPDWFLKSLSIGAFGMHGSSRPLPYGRGRSPMNWSLIQGKDLFYTHLFKYEPGADNGPIVDVQTFDINLFDTCLTLHFKNTISMVRLCAKNLPSLLDGRAKLTPQQSENATYYPKRSEEDGLIYWEDSTDDIYNLIRAVTKPFPGAFSYLDNEPNKKVHIWRAQPFDTKLAYADSKPGEIVEVFYNGMFAVKTIDSTILVTESEGHNFTVNDIGKILGHLNIPRKKWENLPE
ncbi:MAG: formyltransferase family protein [Nanoarchaeota archaeon]|nr:formyltransferase family protein [Nanoarchaeota archaeon]